MEYSIVQARVKLSEIVKEALAGKEVVLTKNGHALVRLVPVAEDENRPLKPGSAKHLGIWIAEDAFDRTLPEFEPYLPAAPVQPEAKS